jgi:excisionase family DNA binding protein
MAQAQTAMVERLRAFPTGEAAELLGMSQVGLRGRIRAGHIRAARIGRCLYVPADEIERVLSLTTHEVAGR